MSWWGKALGGACGFMIGGPLGALMGIAFGQSFVRGMGSMHGAKFVTVLESSHMGDQGNAKTAKNWPKNWPKLAKNGQKWPKTSSGVKYKLPQNRP